MRYGRHAAVVALALLPILMARPAQAQAEPRAIPPPPACARHQARFPALIGGDPAAVEAALRAMPGIAAVRVGGPGTPMTMDHRPDRATVLVVDGRVARITCG